MKLKCEPWPPCGIIGTAMIPQAEVDLIFDELWRTGGSLDNQAYHGMIIVIGLSSFLPPFVMKAT